MLEPCQAGDAEVGIKLGHLSKVTIRTSREADKRVAGEVVVVAVRGEGAKVKRHKRGLHSLHRRVRIQKAAVSNRLTDLLLLLLLLFQVRTDSGTLGQHSGEATWTREILRGRKTDRQTNTERR